MALYCMGTSRLGGGLGLAAAVAAEGARRSELAELMTHHVLGHVQFDELPAIVDGEGRADEFRHDGAIARPRLDRLLFAAALLPLDLGGQALVNMRPLLQ